MASFDVKLRDGTVETVQRADAYRPDGALTTFFAFEDGRSTIDCWSVRVASIRTTEIVAVWRRESDWGAHAASSRLTERQPEGRPYASGQPRSQTHA